MAKQLVSIGMPVRNGAKTIHATILSIIGQSYDDWELLVVNDGCTDNTLDIVQSFGDKRIRIIGDQRNLGIPIRLNEAINESSGSYFARMDADDICFPNRLEVEVDYLNAHQNVDIVASSILLFGLDGSVSGIVHPKETHIEICSRPWMGFVFPHPTWMGRSGWFKSNNYPIEANGIEDQNLLFSTYRQSNFAGIPEVLVAYRDDRNLRKLLKKRALVLRTLCGRAYENGDFFNFILLMCVLPLKAICDFLFAITKVSVFRNKLQQPSGDLLDKWNSLTQLYSVDETYT